MSTARPSTSAREDQAEAAAAMSTPSDGKLPLPEDFFTVPQLNPKEAKYLMGLAKHACKEVVYYSRRSGGPMQWVHLASEDGVEVYQGMDASSGAAGLTMPGGAGSSSSSASSALTYLRGSCRIHASLDEIADFFKLDTAEKLAGFAQTVGKDLLDQKTLLTLATPTPENPKHYVAVKWTAVESPSKLARNRDFCYLESHDEFIDTQSRKRGWVRSIHSIRLPFCPPLRKSHGLVRGSFYRSGFIFIESNGNGSSGGTYVDAIHTLHLDIKGHAPMWVKLLVMKRRIKNIAQVNAYFQMRRLARGPRLLGEFELPAKNGVTRCQLCETKFGLFHRKWRCRKCGRVVCTNCGHHFLIDSAAMTGSNAFITASGSGSGNGVTNANTAGAGGGNSGAGQLKKVRICVQCSENVVFGDGTNASNDTVATVDDSNRAAPNNAENAGARAPVGKRVQESIRPVYDESPGSSASTENPLDSSHQQHHTSHHKNSIISNPHQFSIEENEYYAANEDAAGIADMVEAKRMAHEFEEAVLKSSRGPRNPSRSLHSNASGSSDRAPHHPAAQYQLKYEEKSGSSQRQHISKGDRHVQRGAVAADMGTTPASDASTAVSGGLRNPFSQSFELGRKDSMDSIRMSSDWGSGADGNQSHRHPPPHRGNPIDESHARRARAERPSGLTNSLLSSVDSPSASNSMAMAAAAAANRGSDASMDRASRPSDATGRPRSPKAVHRSHDQIYDRQRSFLSDDGWGYRSHRLDSGNSDDDRGFYDAPPRDRLISSHDPASLRRFIAEARRSSGDKSEEADRENASLSTHSLDGETGEHRVDDGTLRRRTKEYFNARNARLAQLENHVGDSVRHYTESADAATSHHRGSGDGFADGEDREYERRRRQQRRNRSADSDSFIGRQAYDQHGSRDLDGANSAIYRGNTRGRGDSDDTISTATGGPDEELAQYMAIAAMRLYEQEMGPRLRVSEDTKRAALRKMMVVYAQEIERSVHLDRRGPRPNDRYEENRGRYVTGHNRYSNDEAPRERRRRRGSSVDDIGDDSRSYYQQLMGGASATAQVPEQHSLHRSVSDQRYTTSHHRQGQHSYHDRYLRDDDGYVGAAPVAGDDGDIPSAGPLPAVGLGRVSIDSSSSDEDEEENRRRRRRGVNSAGDEDAAAHEYRDLADISSRTFQELQIQSFGPGNGLTDRRHDGNGGRAEESKVEHDSLERQVPHRRHHSRRSLEEAGRNVDDIDDRRNNETIISTVEANNRSRIDEEDDSGSISNSYRQNDSFIGQPSPRFMRDSISTIATTNGKDRRHSSRYHRADTGSSSEDNRAASHVTGATSTMAMRDTTTNGEGDGANGDADSIRSSSTGGMELGVDRTTYGSLASSDMPRGSTSSGYYARPNSMHEVAESDTFSEMDLSELPHLMRKDDEAEVILRRSMAMMDRRSVGGRSSFTDLQRWEPSSGGVSSGATAASTPNDTGRMVTNDIDAEQGQRLSDLPADRDGAAVALGMRSLGGPQHVRQFSDDSSTDSFMRGWGSDAVAAALAPDTPSPVSSSSSNRHRGRRQDRSFGPVPTSISSEPRLSGASGDFRVAADRLRGTNTFSDTSSSFYSDDGDYRASSGAYSRHHGPPHHLVPDPRSPSLGSDRQQQHLSVSELRRFRKSISELLSEYSDGDSGYHQPEVEPDREREEGEPVVPTVVANGSSSRQEQRGPAAFPSEGAAGNAPAMSRGSEKIRELFL